MEPKAIRGNDLVRMQAAGETVERRMLDFLLQFGPCGSLTISDAKRIADRARVFAFDAMSGEIA